MFKKLLVIATLAAGLISTQASAAFVSTDWKSAGDGLATLDTSTGIEWMDLNQTRGRSIQDVMNNLSTEFAGWRLPTQSEVQQMMRNFFGHVYTFKPTDTRVNSRKVTNSTIVAFENLFSFYRHSSGYDSTFYSRALYLGDDNMVKSAGSRRAYDAYWGDTSEYLDYAITISSSLDYRGQTCAGSTLNLACYSVWLVNDGGVTLSSINDPTININNPNAPINMADVSAPVGLAAAWVLMLMLTLGARRRSA